MACDDAGSADENDIDGMAGAGGWWPMTSVAQAGRKTMVVAPAKVELVVSEVKLGQAAPVVPVVKRGTGGPGGAGGDGGEGAQAVLV